MEYTKMKNLNGIVLFILIYVFCYIPFIAAQSDKNKETVRKMVNAVNTRNYEIMDELFVNDFVRHCQATPDLNIKSLEEMKDFLKRDLKVFPDSRIDIEMLLAEGDLVAGLFTFSATQEGAMGPFPATGKKVNLNYLGILRFNEGRIAEMWVEWDNISILTQLGHFPPANNTEN
jgi:predicted ester cyclase